MIFGLGTATWFVYGVLRSDVAVAAANGVPFALVAMLTVAKFTTRPRTDG